MKLYSISIFHKDHQSTRQLKAAHDLTSFGFFQRSSVQEFMVFSSRVLVERSHRGSRQSLKEREYICHVRVRADGLAGVVVSDAEYPNRVAHTLLDHVLDEFSQHVPATTWATAGDDTVNYTGLADTLQNYQNPNSADSMSKIQSDLDETKIILHNTIQSVLERGEKLDDLVAKSEDLSMQSKTFYKTARKTNSCCGMG